MICLRVRSLILLLIVALLLGSVLTTCLVDVVGGRARAINNFIYQLEQEESDEAYMQRVSRSVRVR